MSIRDFARSEARAIGNMDITTFQPIIWAVFHPLWAKEWIARIEKVVDKAKGISFLELADAFAGTSSLRAQFGFLLCDMKHARVPKQKRKEIAEFFHRVLLAKAKDDPYGWKSNIGHTGEEIKQIMKKKFEPGTPNAAKLLGRLTNSCYHLANGYYYDFYCDYSIEYFGPYYLEDGSLLIIKHFEDLKPGIWEVNSPCKTITLYSVYNGVEFITDAISCHAIYKGDVINGLDRFRVEVDGKVPTLEQLEKINDKIAKIAIAQWQKLMSLPMDQVKKQGVIIRCFIWKSFFDKVGIGWEPDKAMLDAVKGDKLYTDINLPEGDQADYWAKLGDPDTEFYG